MPAPFSRNPRLEDKRVGQLSKLPTDVLQHQLDDDHLLQDFPSVGCYEAASMQPFALQTTLPDELCRA
jgi:hypothetical protein